MYRRCELMTLTFDLGCHRDCRSYASCCFVRVPSANFLYGPHGSHIPCHFVTLTFNLEGHGACRWCGSTSSIRTPTLKFLGLTVRNIWHILCFCVSRPVTLTFNLLTLKLVRSVESVMGYPPANFSDPTTIRFRVMGHWVNAAQTDHVTVWPWSLTLEVTAPVADAGCRFPSVYQVWSS